ncbi:MAG: CrcB family protein [Anaerovoracaceae bacterium]
MNLLLVGLGGGMGALLRLLLSALAKKLFGRRFPYGTLGINVIGSFLLGLLLAKNIQGGLLLFLGTGILGGFTTFSTLNYEAARMVKDKAYGKLLLYLTLTYGLGLGSALLGMMLCLI